MPRSPGRAAGSTSPAAQARAGRAGASADSGGRERRDGGSSRGAQGYPGAGRSLDPLRVIALFKFLKAVLLIATGYGVHLLLNESMLQRLRDWTFSLTDSLAQRLLLHALEWVESLGAKRIHIVMAVTLGYTAVVLCEGTGLWMRRAWAEWLTVIATASLVPFELWELITRPLDRKLAVLATLIVNLTIVWYLAWLLRRSAQAHQHARAADTHTSRRSTG